MTLTETSAAKVAEQLEAALDPRHAALWRPRFNVAPSDVHWLVRAAPGADPRLAADAALRRELVPARWGFGQRDGRPLINARSESLAVGKRSPLSRALEERRCVVPADGFFEWTGPKNARRPLWFHRSDGGLLYLAGVYETGPDGRPQFVVLTTEASGAVAKIHDRMPALLAPERVAEWLARPAPELLAPAPAGMLVAQAVSPRVNDVRNDDPSCLEKPEPAESPGKPQMDLF